ncbi:hypothetical protein F2Q68_00029830 [Brassica cretica]|uniref:Uncharacterized protein n=1 Tax=Brassica cretica TaxID=69181 RepID=A0A8S9GFW7_BRACR|nr:hypothetical protein F2Q68_00029830 [Brassica cretica]
MSSWGFFSWFKVYGRFNLNNTYSHCWILGRFRSQQRLAVITPSPKLLRNKEYEALRRAYGVDMLLLDPKAVVTATMVLERPDGKSERLYCTVSASEVVKSHPGHHLTSSPPL